MFTLYVLKGLIHAAVPWLRFLWFQLCVGNVPLPRRVHLQKPLSAFDCILKSYTINVR